MFEERDALFARTWDEIVLWFEHDLYDELQWLQVLDRLYGRAGVSLIRTQTYLGEMTPRQLAACELARRPAAGRDYEEARRGWLGFTADTPEPLAGFPALRRLCEEYPWTSDGCSRTERAILRLCAAGVRERGALFSAYQETEEAKWLGDWPFFDCVEGLQRGARQAEACPTRAQPLLDSELKPTAKGRAVLEGTDDRILGNGIDCWIGGVHLAGPDTPWRWDALSAGFRRGS
jgi:hypothetical protein